MTAPACRNPRSVPTRVPCCDQSASPARRWLDKPIREGDLAHACQWASKPRKVTIHRSALLRHLIDTEQSVDSFVGCALPRLPVLVNRERTMSEVSQLIPFRGKPFNLLHQLSDPGVPSLHLRLQESNLLPSSTTFGLFCPSSLPACPRFLEPSPTRPFSPSPPVIATSQTPWPALPGAQPQSGPSPAACVFLPTPDRAAAASFNKGDTVSSFSFAAGPLGGIHSAASITTAARCSAGQAVRRVAGDDAADASLRGRRAGGGGRP